MVGTSGSTGERRVVEIAICAQLARLHLTDRVRHGNEHEVDLTVDYAGDTGSGGGERDVYHLQIAAEPAEHLGSHVR